MAGLFNKREEETASPEKYPETVEQLEIARRREERIAADAEKRMAAEQAKRRKKRKKARLSTTMRGVLWGIGIIVVLFLAFACAHLFCKSVTVREGSMEPTLSAGDVCLIDKAAYRIRAPRRGDLIVFRSADDGEEADHIKRIIGLPGETIQIQDGKILIDGKEYKEAEKFSEILDAGLASDPIVLLDDEYFVLGDNRNGSEDSRYAQVGNIDREEIIGKLWLRIQPFSKFGFL